MLLAIDNIAVRFGGLAALKAVSFGVAAGEIFSVIGPNGAGKTTLFNVVTGFQKATSGNVHFDGAALKGKAPHDIARLGMVRTFQKTEVFPELTVAQCVRIGFLNTYQPSLFEVFVPGRRMKEFLTSVMTDTTEILDTVGLGAKHGFAAQQLSYGEQRWLEVAVAVAAQPRLLLLDEPFSGLNLSESAQLSGLIRKLRARGITIVLIEHNMNIVMRLSDRIAVLHHGEKIAEGAPADIARNADVVAAYLGREWVMHAAG
jgi:branched-chain amino acid transport system ATP-binding protein